MLKSLHSYWSSAILTELGISKESQKNLSSCLCLQLSLSRLKKLPTHLPSPCLFQLQAFT